MTASTTGDLDALWDLQHLLAETGPGVGLPVPLLHAVRELFRADVVSCNAMDSRARRHAFAQEVTADHASEARDGGPDEAEVAFWRHYWQSFCSYPERTGDGESVLRISDFVGPSALHDTPMYAECLRPQGVEHELLLVLRDAGNGRSVRLLLARGSGPDFSDQDKFLVELLRPHLRAAYARCESERAGAALTARQRDVLRHVLDGATNQAIARRLGIAEGTVRTHLQNAYAALGVSSRTAAAVRAAELD